MSNSAILLAAGCSTRFGRDKRRELIAGIPLLLQSALAYKRLVGDTIVVLGPDDTELAELLRNHDIASCPCEGSTRGMGYSVAAGVAQRAGSDGWLIAPADLPLIRADTIEKVLHAGRVHAIAAPVYRGQRGHPVWFDATYLSALRGLSGDHGAKAILSDHSEDLHLIEVDDVGCVFDIDYPTDLALARARMQPSG